MADVHSSTDMNSNEVPEVVVMRLPQYLRTLTQLNLRGIKLINSQQLGEYIQITPAQIRKDLSYFGKFGKQGRGYSVKYLQEELKRILKVDMEWNLAVIGVGRLGRAILNYPGFTTEGFKVTAAFDSDPRQIGQMVGGIMVQPMHRMQDILKSENIKIAVVAVPGTTAQQVINQLVEYGIKAIVTYAPITPQVPTPIKLRSIDPVTALQSMTFYLDTNDLS